MVVVVEAHLKIETHELGHVAVSVGVLGTEHRSNLEHPLEVRAHYHLLVELGGLSKAGLGCSKVKRGREVVRGHEREIKGRGEGERGRRGERGGRGRNRRRKREGRG